MQAIGSNTSTYISTMYYLLCLGYYYYYYGSTMSYMIFQ